MIFKIFLHLAIPYRTCEIHFLLNIRYFFLLILILSFDFAFLHSHWKFLDATVFKANSYEKSEAKISEKSEKKGSEYLKRTSESHVKWISVRLLFALKRKNFFSETGSP